MVWGTGLITYNRAGWQVQFLSPLGNVALPTTAGALVTHISNVAVTILPGQPPVWPHSNELNKRTMFRENRTSLQKTGRIASENLHYLGNYDSRTESKMSVRQPMKFLITLFSYSTAGQQSGLMRSSTFKNAVFGIKAFGEQFYQFFFRWNIMSGTIMFLLSRCIK